MNYLQLSTQEKLKISSLKALKDAGYQAESVKEELRRNLIDKMRLGKNVFEGIWGYEDSVIPDIQRAILSRHNINLLGLRGQAKTRIARMMTLLLDEYIPVLAGTELNDDPMQPISRQAVDILKQEGDQAAISWMHRAERYTEKLATPDVSVADLIGDVDPIKAATLKLPYSDERVIHYGLIPRSHRGIFVINELPDLQARIQVALFNILQEGDIQIRGFKLRLPLDIQFVFTANPEDYTNRGSIITPLKDRIDAQIITHYPQSIDIGRKITAQEAAIKPEQHELVDLNELSKNLIEQIAIEARASEYIDEKSGVSARLTISAYESLVSAAERRALITKENKVFVRMTDFVGVIPAITGKVELVYEGEQEGPGIVAQTLVGKAIRTQFTQHFPNPEDLRKKRDEPNPYKPISKWFNEGKQIDILHEESEKEYRKKLDSIPGLSALIKTHVKRVLTEAEKYFMMEFALHGMAEFSLLSKHALAKGHSFKDLLSSMINFEDSAENDDDFNI